MASNKSIDLLLSSITHKGDCIGRTSEGEVIFVHGGVPGDLVRVQLTRKRKGVKHGFVVDILEPSKDRTTPKCSHFGVCGGCSWQNVQYSKQLQLKEQIVQDALKRIAKVSTAAIEKILGSEEEYYYRNKLEFTFSSRRWLTKEEIGLSDDQLQRSALGFHRPGTFDKIVDIDNCHLQIPLSNRIRNALKKLALDSKWSFYDVKNHSGLLRNLIIKTNEKGEALIVLSLSTHEEEIMETIFSFLRNNFPEIKSAHYAINNKKNDAWQDLVCIKAFGDDFLLTQLAHVKYQIGPKSFFQTNPNQSLNLYNLVLDFAELKGDENVFDLYCGVGSIGLFLAHKVSKVLGIEEIKEAIDDAWLNAKINEIENVEFIAGDVLKILNQELIHVHGSPDVLIVDPPRAGIHAEVIQQMINLAPQKIVYVSCNPSTAARDINLLSEHYEVRRVKPVDMFPMTNHIEMVAQLYRRR